MDKQINGFVCISCYYCYNFEFRCSLSVFILYPPESCFRFPKTYDLFHAYLSISLHAHVYLVYRMWSNSYMNWQTAVQQFNVDKRLELIESLYVHKFLVQCYYTSELYLSINNTLNTKSETRMFLFPYPTSLFFSLTY